MKPVWQTLSALLDDRGEQQSTQTAFTFLEGGEREAGSLTFGELQRRARQIAAELERRGASRSRVLLAYPSGLDFIAALFGCFHAGTTAVPVPTAQGRSRGRLEAIVADAEPSVVLTTAALADLVARRLTSVPAVDIVGTDEIMDRRDPVEARSHVDGDALALLQYTSGSIDRPKGVMVTHANILHNQGVIRERFEHTPDSVVASWLPMFHDMGLIGKILQPVYVGCHCILMSPDAFLQRPARWLRAISKYRVTTSGGPNFAYEMCVDRTSLEERQGLDLSSWGLAFNGSEPVRPGTLEKFTAAFEPVGFRREAFYACYGLAEASLFVAGGTKAAPPHLRPLAGTRHNEHDTTEPSGSPTIVGCGRAAPDHQLIVVDPASHRSVAEGGVGEIWFRGPSVARGYWKRPEETRETFETWTADGEGPFLRTGDLGFVVKGELFVTGRLKEVMIVRGRNHYPQDIERTAEGSHPALRPGSGAAFLLNEGERGEHLVLVHEVRREYMKDLPLREMARQAREAVATEHGLNVGALVVLRAGGLPRTSSGKIQRRLCRAQYLARTLGVLAEDRHGTFAPRQDTPLASSPEAPEDAKESR